jgi:hypothetical protein
MQSQSDRDSRVRDRAYRIWLSQGRPDGHDAAHWHQAQREIEAEDAGSAGGKPAPARPARPKKAPVTSEARPPTVSRARADDETAANKSHTRPATGARAKTALRRTNKTTQ